MKLQKNRLVRLFSILFVLMFLAWTMPVQSLARAGRGMSGGGSFGSRGSRSTTPVTPYTPPSSSVPRTTPYTPGYQPATPGRPATPATPYGNLPPASTGSTGGFWRNVGGGMLGGFAGGMLSNWLFGGGGGGGTPAQGGASGTAAGGGGFGFFDLILLAGIGYILYRFLVKKPQEQAAGDAGAYQSSATGGALQAPYYEQTAPPTELERDLDTGLGHIKSMDPLFTEEKFKDQAMDFFFKIQGAWSDRDLSTVKHLLTPEMFRLLQEDADKMRQEGQINKIENIAVREVNPTEAWQESGQDYITFRVYANLLDYTIDEKTGEIVTGSKSDPVKFEEYWTFTRAVGNNPWQLSAINQAE